MDPGNVLFKLLRRNLTNYALPKSFLLASALLVTLAAPAQWVQK
jgi:hypothetical protein